MTSYTDFLATIHPDGYHDLRALDSNSKSVKTTAHFAAGDLLGIQRFVETNAPRWDIFMGVATRNAKGRTLADCLTLYTLFADLDFKHTSEEDARATLAAFPLPPSAVIASGGGLHCYWFLNPPLDLRNDSGPQVKRMLKAFATALGSDLKSVDAAHILRVPGTLNHKYSPPRPVVMEVFDRGLVYELGQVFATIPMAVEEDEPEPTTTTSEVLHLDPKEKIRQAREFLSRQKPAIEGQGGDAYTFNICCFVVIGFDLVDENAQIALAKWNARCEPPWTTHALFEKLHNAVRYGKGVRGNLLEPIRPRIIIRGGALTSIVDQAEDALILAHVAIYKRGGILIHPVTLDKPLNDSIHREAGSIILVAVREPWLIEQMGKTARWIQKTAKGAKRIDPPSLYARTYTNRSEWQFPALRSVVTAPTLARDGRIIETPGFDKSSGLLLDFTPRLFPLIPRRPTRDQARDALSLLAHPLRDFPFVTPAAKSVAISAILTALIRPSLRTSPLHGYDAPTAGTGKSLLAEAAGLLATGYRPPALSQGKSDEEDEKRLSSVLFAGDPVIHIDNCERPIGGDFLSTMLTQEEIQARILGLSEMRKLPSTALLLASGNNLTFAGDSSRRAVVCRLDAQVERPDTRIFTFDFHDEIIMARPELVVAGLTMLRAYAESGRPVTLQPMGSFNDWEWVRGTLVWLDCADPADTRMEILENDPKKNDLLEIMELWATGIGTVDAIEIAEIDRRAEAHEEGGPAALAKRERVITLRNRLIDTCCRGRQGSGGKWSAKSVGWWLRKNKDRVIGGYSFKSTPGHGVQLWTLHKLMELT